MEQTHTQEQTSSLQITLAHSYLVYFIFSLLGLLADTIFDIGRPIADGQWIALACFIIGPAIIFWAQATSAKQDAIAYFQRGPYRFVRNPTQIGVLILISGYSAVSGSMIFLLTTLVSYLISNRFFKKYESILHRQYGADYKEYKDTTPKVL
jgi:protein-S-isoprenylcysteine O-methyltransferase Ste14